MVGDQTVQSWLEIWAADSILLLIMWSVIPSCDYQHLYLESLHQISVELLHYIFEFLVSIFYIGTYLELLLLSLYMCKKVTRHVKERKNKKSCKIVYASLVAVEKK